MNKPPQYSLFSRCRDGGVPLRPYGAYCNVIANPDRRIVYEHVTSQFCKLCGKITVSMSAPGSLNMFKDANVWYTNCAVCQTRRGRFLQKYLPKYARHR